MTEDPGLTNEPSAHAVAVGGEPSFVMDEPGVVTALRSLDLLRRSCRGLLLIRGCCVKVITQFFFTAITNI